MLSARFVMVHDAGRGGEDDVPELTRRQQLGDPLFELVELDVVARRDAACLVDAARELDDDLAGAVVVHLLELVDVSCEGREMSAWTHSTRFQQVPEARE